MCWLLVMELKRRKNRFYFVAGMTPPSHFAEGLESSSFLSDDTATRVPSSSAHTEDGVFPSLSSSLAALIFAWSSASAHAVELSHSFVEPSVLQSPVFTVAIRLTPPIASPPIPHANPPSL